MQTEKNQSWRSCMSNSYIISGSLNWKEHTVKNNYVLWLEGNFMGPTGTQGQMLCGVHLPHSIRASKQYLGSFINVIDVAIPIRCQKWFGGILWTSDNEKVMRDPVCTARTTRPVSLCSLFRKLRTVFGDHRRLSVYSQVLNILDNIYCE